MGSAPVISLQLSIQPVENVTGLYYKTSEAFSVYSVFDSISCKSSLLRIPLLLLFPALFLYYFRYHLAFVV